MLKEICPKCRVKLHDYREQFYSCGDKVALRANPYPVWIILGYVPKQKQGLEYTVCLEDNYDNMKSIRVEDILCQMN